jgi:hypothetical protein
MRRTRRLTLVAVATLALGTAWHPSAQASCPALDATCKPDTGVSGAKGLVDDVSPPVDTPVDDTIRRMVASILDNVFDHVRDVLGGVPADLPDPIGDGHGGSHGVGPPFREQPRSTADPADRNGRNPVGGRNADGPGPTSLPGPAVSAASGVAPSGSADRTSGSADRTSGSPDRTSGNRFGGALDAIARNFALLLALFGLAVGFVAVQDRFDRHDPRLALAPVESDVVEFV